MKTLIGTNVLTSVGDLAYGNHCQTWFRLGRNSKDDFIFYTPARATIDRMRNESARIAMEAECDYLMFVDDDVLLPQMSGTTVYDQLKNVNSDIVAGNVIIRGYPFEPMFFKKVMVNGELTLPYYRDWKESVDEEGVLRKDVGAVGFSCVLIKVSLLKKLTKPFFITGSHHTEDVYFCLKAMEEVSDVTIAVNTNVKCGHVLTPEIITDDNIKAHKIFCETLNPNLLQVTKEDRGNDYHKQVENALVFNSKESFDEKI